MPAASRSTARPHPGSIAPRPEPDRSTAWARASGLHERVGAPDPATIDRERGARRLTLWQSQTGLDDVALAARLAGCGFDLESFAALLGEDDDSLASRLEPASWTARIDALYTGASAAPGGALEGAERLFLTPFLPLIHDACARLAGALASLARREPRSPVAPDVAVELLWPLLARRLVLLARRALIIELHATDSEDRFESLVERLRQPSGALELLADYPVLARSAVELCEQWLDASLEMLQRLAADADRLPTLDAFGAGSARAADRLVELAGDLSDPHRGGRSVMVLRFASGLRVVYKPKPLAVDARFQDLLGWLAEAGLEPPPRRLGVLDRGDYGWVEFVPQEPCRSDAEVARFFRRQGAYVALLYALGATDFHHENLIAAGEHPVLIDLECLFHPRLRDGGLDVAAVYAESVLASGMLPQRIWDEAGSGGVDISGLGAGAGRDTPMPVLHLVDDGTDAMRIDRRVARLPDPHSTPRLGERELSPADHADDLLRGFEDTYRLLVDRRRELLAADGPLARFADAPIRILARPTHAYTLLLDCCAHPFRQRDGLDRDRLLDRLWSITAMRPAMRRLVPAEQRELRRGDVPVFVARAGSRDLECGDGEVLENALVASGLEQARSRIERLDEDDLVRQARVVRGTLRGLELSRRAEASGRPAVVEDEEAPHGVDAAGIATLDENAASEAALPTARAYLDAAVEVAERLAEVALLTDGDGATGGGATGGVREVEAHWLDLQPVGDTGAWSYDPLGVDLYKGRFGIGLFFAEIAAATGDARWRTWARRTLDPTERLLVETPDALPSIGAYAGWGGVLWARLRLAALDGRSGFDEAFAAAAEIDRRLADDSAYDVLAGAAGGLLAVLRLHRLAPSNDLVEIARRCGEHLLAAARPVGDGFGWATDEQTPLLGLSHGAAGIAWALAELADVTDTPRFAEAAARAMAYERGLFDAGAGNWPDLRPHGAGQREHGRHEHGRHEHDTSPRLCAWCHGAAGVGLARLAVRAALPAAARRAVDAEITAAVATTLRGFDDEASPLGNHSLCHGGWGNLELLEAVAAARGDDRLARRAEQLAARLLRGGIAHGWRGGLSAAGGAVDGGRHDDTPGLMLGLAGVGHSLLRRASDATGHALPSVLRFEVRP